MICLTKVILFLKGQVTDTNRRLQDAGKEVRALLSRQPVLLPGRVERGVRRNLAVTSGLIEGALTFCDLCLCKVTAQTEEVIRCRIQQRNMATTVEKLQLCIPGEMSCNQ